MSKVTYSKSCVLQVKQADNAMTVYLNADISGPNAVVFAYDTNKLGTAPPNASVDLTPALGALDGSGKLSIVGANFTGGGGMEVNIVADGNPQNVAKDNLPTFTSKMWTVDIVKS